MVKTVAILVELLTDGASYIREPGTMLTGQHRYVERLEGEREILSLGLQEACRRLIMAGVWPTESLPPDGRPHSVYELLVALGMISNSKDKDSAGEHSEKGRSAQMRRESSLAARRPSVDQALNTRSYQNLYTPGLIGLDVLHGGRSGSRETPIDLASAQPATTTLAPTSSSVVATLSKKSSITVSRATDLRPDAAPVTALNFQAVLSHPNGQLWRHTTDAYQEVSGPSNVRKRNFAVIATAQDLHHQGIIRQHGSDYSSGTYEAVPSGQEETSPESDGDTNDHIRIAF